LASGREPLDKEEDVNIFLWILQIGIAVFCGAGAVWRFFNYAAAAQDVPSMAALSRATWNIIGVFEVVCALGLVLPGLLGMKPGLTPIAASLLAVEMLLITVLHAKYFGLTFQATNPAIWSLGLSLAAAFVAYGRFVVRPL
jgi:hypothetical protein